MATRKSSHTISVYAYRFHVPGSEVAIFPSRKKRLIRWSGRPDGERITGVPCRAPLLEALACRSPNLKTSGSSMGWGGTVKS